MPSGGAEGLTLVLGLFGILLLILARKEKISPSTEGEEINSGKREDEKENENKQ